MAYLGLLSLSNKLANKLYDQPALQTNQEWVFLPKDERLLFSPVTDGWSDIPADVESVEQSGHYEPHLGQREFLPYAHMSPDKKRLKDGQIVVRALLFQETLRNELLRIAEICCGPERRILINLNECMNTLLVKGSRRAEGSSYSARDPLPADLFSGGWHNARDSNSTRWT